MVRIRSVSLSLLAAVVFAFPRLSYGFAIESMHTEKTHIASMPIARRSRTELMRKHSYHELQDSTKKGALIGVGVAIGVIACMIISCCWFRATLTRNMREPEEGWFGRLAIKIMDGEGNRASSRDMAERAGISADQVIVELGSGHGALLTEASKKGCKRIVGIEISKAFRDVLAEKQETDFPNAEIRDDDAKAMSFLEDGSVDTILGMNVVYFLDPLEDYLKEFKRVLRPGGLLFWGGKFKAAGAQDSGTCVNQNKDKIVQTMKEAGFEVEEEEVNHNGGEDKGDYTALLAFLPGGTHPAKDRPKQPAADAGDGAAATDSGATAEGGVVDGGAADGGVGGGSADGGVAADA